MRRMNRRKGMDSEGHNVWRSYSDMMSGLLLLFVLIMAVCLMQAQKNYTEKLDEQEKQMLTQYELSKTQGQLSEQEVTLAQQESELQQKENDLASSQSTLNEQNKLLQAQEAELAKRDEELKKQNQELVASQSKLDEQTAVMKEQQQKIDKIIGVKADLIKALNEEFVSNQINVDIDTQTGAIMLDSSVLFDYNQSVLTDAGTGILAQVLPIYCKVLLSDKYKEYLAEVIIDGYTDTTGDYISNLDLSQRRAFAVAEYLMSNENSFLSEEEGQNLTDKLTANGRSMSNPILDQNGDVNMDASRRVEIKFRLKDEEMLAELQDIMSK